MILSVAPVLMSNGFYFPWMPSISKCPSSMKYFPKHKFPCCVSSYRRLSLEVFTHVDIKIHIQFQIAKRNCSFSFSVYSCVKMRILPVSDHVKEIGKLCLKKENGSIYWSDTPQQTYSPCTLTLTKARIHVERATATISTGQLWPCGGKAWQQQFADVMQCYRCRQLLQFYHLCCVWAEALQL